MPLYEFRCEACERISSIYFRTTASSPEVCCRHCGGDAMQRILSAFASPQSEQQKMDKLDPKYHRQVDAALAKAPAASHPDHYLSKMMPFSSAKES